MPGGKYINAGRSAVVYLYDGSFEGLLCCVFESVYSRVVPADIQKESDAPLTLLQTVRIETDAGKAKRVLRSIHTKLSDRALELVQTVFLSCLEQKELYILRFLLRGYTEGGKVIYKLGDADVAPLLKAEQNLTHEAYLLRGFVRFSDNGESLVSTITPKNFVLPFIAGHFIARYHNETFLIFDKTHRAALIWRNREKQIIELEGIDFPDVPAEEERYRSLWKRFYNTIAIEARENPRCRMTHMPKRYWENMLEVQDLL